MKLVLSTSPLLSFSNWNSYISLTFSSFCCNFYLLIVLFLDSGHLFELLFWIRCRPQLVQPMGFNQLLPFYSESLDMQMDNRRPHTKTDLLCTIIISSRKPSHSLWSNLTRVVRTRIINHSFFDFCLCPYSTSKLWATEKSQVCCTNHPSKNLHW